MIYKKLKKIAFCTVMQQIIDMVDVRFNITNTNNK